MASLANDAIDSMASAAIGAIDSMANKASGDGTAIGTWQLWTWLFITCESQFWIKVVFRTL